MLAVGLMSGTSLDGVDAALVRILPRGESYALELLRFETFAYTPALRDELLAALPPNAGTFAAAARLHRRLGETYGRAARAIASEQAVDYVACHGQTVWHDGAAHITLQLGDAFAIREAVGATVCYDFRSADCAAGGHGAPLAAGVDAMLLWSAGERRVALNLGGIANVTLLDGSAPRSAAVAFDTGPGNMLLDAFVRERTAGAQTFDRDGALAADGRVDAALLDAMLADDYFSQPPPKTTGRERFGAGFLARYGTALGALSLPDGAATLAELTAASIGGALARANFRADRAIVSGGGARNRALMSRIAQRLRPARVETSDAMGLPADAKEAMIFAVLGYQTLRERTGNVPAATGAARAVALGAIAPHGLAALLESVARECRAA